MTTTPTTSLKQVNKAIAAAFPGVLLVKGNGYFYITSDDAEIGLKIAGLFTSSIMVYSIKELTVEGWVEAVKQLLNHTN